MIDARITDGQLVISLLLQAPRPSASGKTLVVASSGGNRPTALEIDGQTVVVGVNAYIAKK